MSRMEYEEYEDDEPESKVVKASVKAKEEEGVAEKKGKSKAKAKEPVKSGAQKSMTSFFSAAKK